jgi:hypothetical protein
MVTHTTQTRIAATATSGWWVVVCTVVALVGQSGQTSATDRTMSHGHREVVVEVVETPLTPLEIPSDGKPQTQLLSTSPVRPLPSTSVGDTDDVGGETGAAASPQPTFGHAMLSEFMLANFTNLNHGSFGATPREVIDAQRRWIDRAEARPDDWFRRDYKDVLAGVRTRVAAMLDADDDDVTFVENASSAMNAVFRSYVTPIRLRLLLLVRPSLKSPSSPCLHTLLNGQHRG